MANISIDTDVISRLPDELSATISDFDELEVENLNDMISQTRQSLAEIVNRAEEKIKYREMQLHSAIEARMNAEETASSAEDGSTEVSSYYYEHEMRCREELEQAIEIIKTIRNLPDSYDNMVLEYNKTLTSLKDNYVSRVNESNSSLNDYISKYIYEWQGRHNKYTDIGDPAKVLSFNEAKGLKPGETVSMDIAKPSADVFRMVEQFSDGKCYKQTTIPKMCLLLPISITSERQAPLTIKGAVVVDSTKGIKHRFREKREGLGNSKLFPNVHIFQYPSIASICVEQFDDFLKNDLRLRAPYPVPITASITAEQMKNNYDQVKYIWCDEKFEYTTRWHTPTSESLMTQGDTWVVHRTTLLDSNKRTEYYVEGKWIEKSEFLKSDYYKSHGHIKDIGDIVPITGSEGE